MGKREPVVTDRLILCDITEADAESMFELDSDPEVMLPETSEPAVKLARAK